MKTLDEVYEEVKQAIAMDALGGHNRGKRIATIMLRGTTFLKVFRSAWYPGQYGVYTTRDWDKRKYWTPSSKSIYITSFLSSDNLRDVIQRVLDEYHGG